MRRTIYNLLLFISVITVVCSVITGGMYIYMRFVIKNEMSFDEFLRTRFASISHSQNADTSESQKNDEMAEENTDDEIDIEIDFKTLKTVNKASVGWIYQKDTPISYPVVQGTDNDYWLYRRFDSTDKTKGSNRSGTIFVDYRCDVRDGNNLILYGHNMAKENGVKFSSLINYVKDDGENYFKEHPSFVYFDGETEEGSVYMIFSVMKADVSTQEKADRYYKAVSDDEYAEYLDFLKSESLWDTGVEPSEDARCVLLSTCVTGHYDVRCLIAGIATEVSIR